VKVFPPAIYLAGIAAGLLLQWAWPVRIAPGSTAMLVRGLGVLLLALWLGLDTWALVTFFRAGLAPNPARPVKALLSHGPYRFTRNPMYLSLALMQIGLALLANSLWMALFCVPALYLVRRLVIDREEEYLARKFPANYQAYKQRVRRWL